MFIVAAALLVNKIFFQLAANFSVEPWFIISNYVTTVAITVLTSLATLIFNSDVQAEVLVILKLKKS